MKIVAANRSSDTFSKLPSASQSKGGSSPHRLIAIKQSNGRFLMCSSAITYVKSEHVYVEINFGGNRQMLHRDSLTGLINELPGEAFMQVHRSYVVNLKWVDRWRSDTLYIGNEAIPVSRNRRPEVKARLQALRDAV